MGYKGRRITAHTAHTAQGRGGRGVGMTDRPGARARGYDRAWERLRARHLRDFPSCSVRGCGRPAEHVDHVVPVRLAPHRRLDPLNLQSLCRVHHDLLTKAYDMNSIRGVCDAQGLPLDPSHPWLQQSNLAAIDTVNHKPRLDPAVAARLKRRAVHGK